MPRVPSAIALVFGALVALVALLVPTRAGQAAEGPPELVVPRVEGLALDGKPTEEAWAKAVAIPADAVAGLQPKVRALLVGGRLFVAVEVPEDPGFPIGVRWMIAADGTPTAAEAVALSFAPQELRGPRYVVRGPRGVTRSVYRFEGAADVSRGGGWSLEAALPIADLALPKADTPIRLAVVVSMRTPNMMSSAPSKAAFGAPSAFALLRPPEGGWAGADGASAPEKIAAEDAADAARNAAFDDFRKARQKRGFSSAEEARAALLPPIDRAMAARPDLAGLLWLRGDIKAALEDPAGAEKDYEAALLGMPHFREAKWALARVLIDRWTIPPDSMPSDYDAAFARLAVEAKARGEDDDAVRIAKGILQYRRGAFAEAIATLLPIVAAHPELDPQGDPIPATARAAGSYAEAWAQELGFRKADEAKGDLPRVKVTTSKGAFLLELYEDEAPNTVANFIWLAKHGFYEGTTFHRVVPFFMVQGGDPSSKTAHPKPGEDGPGWAIKMEPARPPRPRRAFRGVVAMAHKSADDEGSQFFVTTGSSAHLDGQYTVFGRVLEGQEVVDQVTKGDKIVKVEVVRAREHEYRPLTVAGTPAPEPK